MRAASARSSRNLALVFFRPGDLGAATTVALWEGGLGGLILGTVFVLAKRNLVVPILVHALINLLPALALIRFGS